MTVVCQGSVALKPRGGTRAKVTHHVLRVSQQSHGARLVLRCGAGQEAQAAPCVPEAVLEGQMSAGMLCVTLSQIPNHITFQEKKIFPTKYP